MPHSDPPPEHSRAPNNPSTHRMGQWAGSTTAGFRSIVVATLAAVAGVMPVFLFGASSIFIQVELGLSNLEMGLLIASYFCASAAYGRGGGRLAQSVGAGPALWVSTLAAGAVLLLLGTLGTSFPRLLSLLVVAGVINGVIQPATNLALHKAQGAGAITFGIKQSATPVTTMVAGAAVPLMAAGFGWRWGFVVGAGLAAAVALAVASVLPSPSGRRGAVDARALPIRPLRWLAVAGGLGISSATALSAFAVGLGVKAGLSPASAGWVLAGASVAAIVTQLTLCRIVDGRRLDPLSVVSRILAIATLGLTAMSIADHVVVHIVAFVFTYASVWSWNGLVNFSIVRMSPRAPAAATGVVLTGMATGAAVGPLSFGVLTDAVGGKWATGTLALIMLLSTLSAARAFRLSRATSLARTPV